jgi:hypothetical protein
VQKIGCGESCSASCGKCCARPSQGRRTPKRLYRTAPRTSEISCLLRAAKKSHAPAKMVEKSYFGHPYNFLGRKIKFYDKNCTKWCKTRIFHQICNYSRGTSFRVFCVRRKVKRVFSFLRTQKSRISASDVSASVCILFAFLQQKSAAAHSVLEWSFPCAGLVFLRRHGFCGSIHLAYVVYGQLLCA